MKRTRTLSVFATTYAVALGLTLSYAVILSIYHGNLMHLPVWGSLLIVACLTAPVVLVVSAIIALAINSAASGRKRE